MSVLPVPVPLEQPSGDLRVLLDLVADLTAAARRLEDLAADVGGAVARVPDWHGADADAAAVRASAVAGVAVRTGEGLRTAAARLTEHAGRWQDVRHGVQALRAQQDDDFAVARIRVASPFDPAGWSADGAGAAVEDLEAAEDRRRRAHAALLADLSDDAAATGHVLAGATAGIDGGHGSGRESRVLMHLATELPGWRVPELARRGRLLARSLTDEDAYEGVQDPLAEMERFAAEATDYRADPAFAAAFLTALGSEGVEMLLTTVDHAAFGPGSALAGLLSAALGHARPTGLGDGPVADILSARYVRPDDPSSVPELIASGMAVVAAAGHGGVGLPSETIAGWGRQMTAREHARGPMADRLTTLSADARQADPLVAVTEALAGTGDATAAAWFLADAPSWTVALARPWSDGGAALADVVGLLASAEAAGGESAVHAAFEALGRGLEDNRPDGWTVDRRTAAVIAPELGRAAAAHVAAVVETLMVGVDGGTTEVTDAELRGLGYLTFDDAATAAVAAALDGWRQVQPVPLAADGDGVSLPDVAVPAVAVPAAFLAAREYGQRLDHALDEFEREAAAKLRSGPWDLFVGLPLGVLVRHPVIGPVAGAGAALVQRALGFDGRWQSAEDDGLRFDRSDAAAEAAGAAWPATDPVRAAAAQQASDAFARTKALLGTPVPPTPPDESVFETAIEGAGSLSLPGDGERFRWPRLPGTDTLRRIPGVAVPAPPGE